MTEIQKTKQKNNKNNPNLLSIHKVRLISHKISKQHAPGNVIISE